MSGFVHETAVGNSVEWFTPRWVFDALGATFDLDPCTPGVERTHVPAAHGYTLPTNDGLLDPWCGNVWVNPPYGRGINRWLDRCADHAATGGSAIALVPNRTDTAWFQDAADRANAILFPAGRIRFHPGHKDKPATGSPGTGSALIGYGDWAVNILRRSHIPGFITTPRNGYYNLKAAA